MGKHVVLALLTLFTAAAFADGHWNLVSSEHDRATSPAEFDSLLQKYPDVFGLYPPDMVTYASIDVLNLHWDGDTLCPYDDPRLTATAQSHEVCLNDGTCTGNDMKMPGNTDPCGGN